MEEDTTIDPTNMEEIEEPVETIEQIVEDTSILKKKPKKPRTDASFQKMSRCTKVETWTKEISSGKTRACYEQTC